MAELRYLSGSLIAKRKGEEVEILNQNDSWAKTLASGWPVWFSALDNC
jgi:hypothetical protein